MERSADPCKDFYRYACGSWIHAETRGDSHTWWGRGYNEISRRNLLLIHDIVEVAAKSREKSPERRMLGTFHLACADDDVREADRWSSVEPLLRDIEAVDNSSEALAMAGKLAEVGVTS